MSFKRQIPNYLTFARIAAVPLLLGAWLYPTWDWLPLCIVLSACVTDFFDGYLARKWAAESNLGRLLDPNADKLLVATALLLLSVSGFAHPVAVALILCRELFVSGLREFMAERNIVVHVTNLAKWKTTCQMLAIIVLLFHHGYGHMELLISIGDGILWLATALTLITGWQYFKGVLPYLRD